MPNSQAIEVVPTEEPVLESNVIPLTLESECLNDESSKEEKVVVEEKLEGVFKILDRMVSDSEMIDEEEEDELVEGEEDVGKEEEKLVEEKDEEDMVEEEERIVKEEEKIVIPQREPITPCKALMVIPNDTGSFVENEKPPVQDLFEVVNKCLLGLGLLIDYGNITTKCMKSNLLVVMVVKPLKQELFEMAHHGLVGKKVTKKKRLGQGSTKKKKRKHQGPVFEKVKVKDIGQEKSKLKPPLDLKRWAFASVRKKGSYGNMEGIIWDTPD